MKRIEVVGAVIVDGDLVLCAQRGPGRSWGGKWEFPGGKLEEGESSDVALRREIREELSCDVEVGDVVTTTVHDYPFATISLTTRWARLADGNPVASEHAELRWVPAADLGTLDWAPADIPAVQLVMAALA